MRVRSDKIYRFFLFLKWMSKKHESGWSAFTNIYYDKRRKVVCYQRFKEEGFYVSSLIKIDGA